jgi:prevent-host-death family protein
MKKVSITEAKNRLSSLIDGLKGGSSVLIVDRGRPVARLEPVRSGGKDSDDGRLSRLIRDGVVRPGRTALARSLLADPPPRLKGTGSVVAALLEERREGR